MIENEMRNKNMPMQHTTVDEIFKMKNIIKDKLMILIDEINDIELVQKHENTIDNFNTSELTKLGLNPDLATINDKGLLDYNGNVDISTKNLTEIQIKFGKVTGDFNCSFNLFTSLECMPNEIIGDFDCSYGEITSLIGGPKIVTGKYDCRVNKIEDLGGFPIKVGSLVYDFDINKIINENYEKCY